VGVCTSNLRPIVEATLEAVGAPPGGRNVAAKRELWGASS
jgi:hypothetical protein